MSPPADTKFPPAAVQASEARLLPLKSSPKLYNRTRVAPVNVALDNFKHISKNVGYSRIVLHL